MQTGRISVGLFQGESFQDHNTRIVGRDPNMTFSVKYVLYGFEPFLGAQIMPYFSLLPGKLRYTTYRNLFQIGLPIMTSHKQH